MVQPVESERSGVTVHIDYAFMTTEEANEEMQLTFVILDDDKKAMWALGVEQKGVEEGILNYIVGILDQSGYPGQNSAIKSDQEPSILAQKKKSPQNGLFKRYASNPLREPRSRMA